MTDEPTPELDASERRALEAWTPLSPPAGFADRVVAARDIVPQRRRWWIPVGVGALVAAAALAFVLARPPSLAARGELVASQRTQTTLGTRGVVVAEPAAVVRWTIDDDGDAQIEQPAGDVFYRVERGGAFVVHTPAGDVRVTGTCFRIEVTPMNKKHALLSAGAGAALAAAITITVYEGKVIADTKAAQTELLAGTRAVVDGDGTRIEPSATAVARAGGLRDLVDDTQATREELIARSAQQRAKLAALEARLEALEAGTEVGIDSSSEPGRAWFDPSPERLQQFAAECRIRVDEPGLARFQPLPASTKLDPRATPADVAAYNATVGEIAKQWAALVRTLYVEATGDAAGAEQLSVDAMINEIREKSPPDEANQLLKKLSAERAGLVPEPADLTGTSPLERLLRAQLKLGDQVEQALAKQLGAARARELRGNDGWGSRSEWSGCPEK